MHKSDAGERARTGAEPEGDMTMRNHLSMRAKRACLTILASLLFGCAVSTSGSTPSPAPGPVAAAPGQSPSTVDPSQLERLRRIMPPLLRVMNHPRAPAQVKIAILGDPSINAANGGNGEFYVTTGLLQKANDQQLAAVLAHEVAHEDLGHVAKAQALGTGLGIGMVLLDQVFPGTGRLMPIAGRLITSAYSRKEEYAADEHGAELLERSGQSRQLMIDALTWLVQTAGSDSGGFFATHPATPDRIEALKRIG